MEQNLYKSKIFFSLILLVLVSFIVGGSFFVKDNSYLTEKYIVKNLNYYKYNFLFDVSEKGFAGAFSLMNENTEAKMEDTQTDSIPVLVYHGVLENADEENISITDFKNQMFALKKAGWQTVTMRDFNAFIQGNATLPDKSFVLTFDDGRKDSYYPVDPILKTLDYNAVIFVITKYITEENPGNYYLSLEELKQMQKSGRWEIQPHTYDGHTFYAIDGNGGAGHFYSNRLWLFEENRLETNEEFLARISLDFAMAKNAIEEKLHEPAVGFAFPFGDFGENSKNIEDAETQVLQIARNFFPISFYQTWPGKGFPTNYPEDEFLLKRIDVEADWDSMKLLSVLESGQDKELPYNSSVYRQDDWLFTWGDGIIENDTLTLQSHAQTTGSSGFLNGSYLWDNYTFLADIDWISGLSVSLLARYKDEINHVSCVFTETGVRIEERIQNQIRVIEKRDIDLATIGHNRKRGVRVSDSMVQCLVNEKVVAVAYTVSDVLSHGGIGFKIWDSVEGSSNIQITNVSVLPL